METFKFPAPKQSIPEQKFKIGKGVWLSWGESTGSGTFLVLFLTNALKREHRFFAAGDAEGETRADSTRMFDLYLGSGGNDWLGYRPGGGSTHA